jgi:hypothetical protein
MLRDIYEDEYYLDDYIKGYEIPHSLVYERKRKAKEDCEAANNHT